MKNKSAQNDVFQDTTRVKKPTRHQTTPPTQNSIRKTIVIYRQLCEQQNHA